MHYDIHEDAAVVAAVRGTTVSDIWNTAFAVLMVMVPMLAFALASTL